MMTRRGDWSFRSGGMARVAWVALAWSAIACGPPEVLEETVAVGRGGDLVAVGRALELTDSVEGDVMAAGARVRFRGRAGGDLLVAGGQQVLGGVVEGSARAAGGWVGLGARVARNVTLAGNQVVVGPPAVVGGNAYLVGGSVRFDGTAEQLVRIMGGTVLLNGTIRGDVLVEARRLRLGPDAVIEGDLRYRLRRGQDAVLHPGAQVAGAVLPLPARRAGWIPWALRAFWLAGFLVAGAVVLALMPLLTGAVEARVRRRPVASLAAGILMLILIPILLLLVAVTVVGLPLALIGVALLAITMYLAPVVVALWLGRAVLRRPPELRRGARVTAFLLGALLLGLIGFVPIIGPAVVALATVFGFGALVVALWEGALRTEA
jgi:cytoskeletal protein CcmA (bactofilin family)